MTHETVKGQRSILCFRQCVHVCSVSNIRITKETCLIITLKNMPTFQYWGWKDYWWENLWFVFAQIWIVGPMTTSWQLFHHGWEILRCHGNWCFFVCLLSDLWIMSSINTSSFRRLYKTVIRRQPSNDLESGSKKGEKVKVEVHYAQDTTPELERAFGPLNLSLRFVLISASCLLRDSNLWDFCAEESNRKSK